MPSFLNWSMLPWGVLFVALFVVIYRSMRKEHVVFTFRNTRDQHGRLPAIIDAKDPRRELVLAIIAQGDREGTAWEARYHPRDESSTAMLVVSVFGHSDCDFCITHRRPRSRLQELLSHYWIRRVPLRDPAFAREYDVTTVSSRALGEAIFAKAEVREAVGRLFGLGCRFIRNDAVGVDAVWANYPDSPDERPEFLDEAVAVLKSLVLPAGALPQPPVYPRWRRAAAVALPVASWTGMLLLMFRYAGRFQTVEGARDILPWSMGVGLPPAIALAALEVWLLRAWRRWWPDSERTAWQAIKSFGGKICWAFSLSAVLVSSGVAFSFAFEVMNAKLDRAAPTVHIQPIVALEWAESRPCVAVVPWHPAEGAQRIWMGPDEFKQFSVVDADDLFEGPLRLEVTTRPGLFGFEWICSWKLVQGRSSPYQSP